MNFARYPWRVFGLIALSALVFMLRMGNTHLWDQDEGYYATTAAEMYARNDWITPTFNGQLFGHKPPMMFWGMMLGYHCFGVSEQGARFASALFGIGTVLVTYAIAKRLFDSTTAFFSGCALSTSVFFALVSRSATADAHLTFLTALAIYLWIRDYFEQTDENCEQRLQQVRVSTWLATYGVMGLAVLTKGPIGFLFPTAVIGMFLLTEQDHRSTASVGLLSRIWYWLKPYTPLPFLKTVWRMKLWWAALAILVVAGPWYALVQWKTNGAFLQEFIGVHHLGRFSQAMDNHSGPIYYYVIACLFGWYPWSTFAIPVAIVWFQQSRVFTNRSVRLVNCWIGVYLILFSLASTKLPNYVLPAYPALAMVFGVYFAQWVENLGTVHRGWMHAGWGALVLVGVVLTIGIPVAVSVLTKDGGALAKWSLSSADQASLMCIGVAGVPLCLLGGLGWYAIFRKQARLAAGSFVGVAASMMLLLCQWVAPEIDRFQAPAQIAQRWQRQVAASNQQVAVLHYFRPTMVFYFQRDVLFCNDSTQAIEYAKANSNNILVTTESHWKEIESLLPPSSQIIERVAQFPNRDPILVIGNESLLR